jgi:beta-galactosidase
VDEAGNPTDKFMQFRSVIQKHVKHSLPPIPAQKKAIVIPAVTMNASTDVFSILPQPVTAETPLPFESLNQAYGFVLYRTKIQNGRSVTLTMKELLDYAVVFVNGKRVGELNRMRKQDSLHINLGAGEQTIDILVENLGRINYGPNLLKNKKGITERVTLNGIELKGWQMYSLPMTTVNNILYNNKPSPGAPVIKKGTFNLVNTGDTYLDMRNWGKGSVWINGHHLGRYWNIGPQQTIYVPAEWLKKGSNEIVVFELLPFNNEVISTLDKPILSQLR